MEQVGKEVTLADGYNAQDLGGMTFVDLRDRYGLTQLAFNMDKYRLVFTSTKIRA